MKSNKLIILFIFVFTTVFSQEKTNTSIATDSTTITKDSLSTKVASNKWSIEIGTGVSNGKRPYSKGYYSSSNNKIFNSFNLNCFTVGASYNFSEIVGVKMDLAFDRFINNEENKSKPYEVAQYRTTIQAVFNLNNFVRPINKVSRFNLLFHGGLHLAILKPISADYNKIVSNGDNYGGVVFGITPTIKISKKIAVLLDFSSFNNYGQNLTFNGKHSEVSNNSEGQMYSGTFGLSFALDKNK